MRLFYLVFALILHACSCTYAQLPPTTLRGQRDTTSPTTFNYQVPFNQATRTAGTNALIETGNTNLLANPSFEHTTATTAWTASGGTLATDTSTPLFGVKSVTWDSSAATQTLTSTAVAIPRGLYSRNGEASCLIEVASGTATHTLEAFDGTNILASQTVISSTIPTRTTVNFIMPSSGNISLRLVSVASNEPLIEIDDCYLGEARNLSQVSQATYVGGMEQTAATGCNYGENTSSGLTNFVALGTGTGCAAWTTAGAITAQGTNDHRPVYNKMPPGSYMIEFNGTVRASAAGVCIFRLSDGTNTFQQQAFQSQSGAMQTPTLRFHATYTTAGNRTFQLQAADDSTHTCQISNDTGAGGNGASWKFYRFPTQSEQAIRIDQSNYDWIDGGAITITGTTTNPTKGNAPVRDKVFYTRRGQNLLLRYEFQNGGTGSAVGSGDYLFGVPAASGCTIDTARIGTSTTIGAQSASNNTVVVGSASAGFPGTSAAIGYTSVYSTSQLRIMVQTSDTNTTQAVGSAFFQMTLASLTYSAQATVPCVGWQENRGAPLLVGSVTSSSAGAERIERVTIGAACGASPCTITRQSGAVSSVTRTSAGIYPVAFGSGTFAAAPTCTATLGQDAAGAVSNSWIVQITDVSANGVTVRTFNNTGVSVDYAWALICMGPRVVP